MTRIGRIVRIAPTAARVAARDHRCAAVQQQFHHGVTEDTEKSGSCKGLSSWTVIGAAGLKKKTSSACDRIFPEPSLQAVLRALRDSVVN